MGPTLVTGGPPPPVRALAAELFGEVAAGRMLASMNRSACFRAHLHGSSRELTIFQHSDDIMMPRLLREFSSSSRYRIHRSAQAETQQPDGHGVMVDVGCNLGDATIAAWLANAALRVLCLEPMPITYLYLRWNLLANGVPSLTPEMFAVASTKGGVLALPAGASADGRSLSIEYAPDLSGYGITSVSTDTGSIVADSGLAGTRNHAKHRVSADEFLRASGVPSLNLTAWLDAHGVSAVRFLKMDCEGCEHEVLPSLASTLLPRVAHFEGELHHCTGKASCRFGVSARLATARALCASGHNCQQCYCLGHKAALVNAAHPMWRRRSTDPCARGVCHKREGSNHCALFVGQRYGQDATPIYHCDLGPAPERGTPNLVPCPEGVSCWSARGRVVYNLLPRGGNPAKEDHVAQGSLGALAIFDALNRSGVRTPGK